MRITQRQVALSMLLLIIISAGLSTIGQLVFALVNGEPITSVLVAVGLATVALAGLTFLYWRGWNPAGYLLVAFITIATVAVMPESPDNYVTEEFATALFLPPIVALFLTNPIGVAASAFVTIVGMMWRAQFQGVYMRPVDLVIFGTVIGGIILARIVASTAQRAAEQNALRAEQALAKSEEQAHALAEANERANAQIAEQQKLIDLVATLEVPAVQLADGVLFAPIVGHIDTRRAQVLTSRLLEAAYSQRARLIVLDIAGVAMVDTSVARALLNTAQALRLLGCAVTISGISSGVAMTLTHLGVNLEGISTVRSPQEALARHLSSLGPARATEERQLGAPGAGGRPSGNGMARLN